jgi:hypothetical protein
MIRAAGLSIHLIARQFIRYSKASKALSKRLHDEDESSDRLKLELQR